MDLLNPFTEVSEEHDASSSTPNAGGDPKHVVEEEPLDDKLDSVVPDAGADTLGKDTKTERGVTLPTKRNHNVFRHHPKDHSKSVRRQKQHEPGVRQNRRSDWMGLHILHNSELDHGRS